MDGAQLVIAGAGSGKTRVLTYKIAYLLTQGVSPSNILALTFTNKAAREMKERIAKLVGQEYARYLWMGTFHSIFARILRQEADRIGYTHDYTIYDAADSKNLLKQIIKEMELDDKIYKPGMVAARISMAKNNLLSARDYAANRALQQDDRMARLYRMADIYFTYTKRLRGANAMDFDDLLFNMHLLLTQCPDLRDKYQQIFHYILVDEYQDTNYCQARLMLMLAAPQNNICVVGDDAQSIYSFRGANIDNILHFSETFPNARLFKLERNYRSTQNIVGAANSLIKKNRGQIPKEVYSEKEQGEPLHLTVLENDREEGAFIAKSIARLPHNASYSDYAVLYRTNAQSRIIEDELRKQGIPYRIYGSVSFYQRKEIKDALSYLRLIVNVQDEEALIRIINYPARGIGETTLRKLLDAAHQTDTAAFAVAENPMRYSVNLSAATQGKLQRFAAMIRRFQAMATELPAAELAKKVLDETAILTSALADKSTEGQDRYENLQELLSSISEFTEERQQQGEPALITDFLGEVALLTDQDEHTDDHQPRVSLMTVHAAKGLEFPVVFISGMEEKLFPSMFAETDRDMEEERRLFYVAVTRAEKECHITYARQRWRNGSIVFSNESRFLRDIDSRFITRSSAPTPSHTTSFSMPWLSREFGDFKETGFRNTPTRNAHTWDADSRNAHTWDAHSWDADGSSATRKEKNIPSSAPSIKKPLSKTTGMQLKTDRTAISTPYPIGCRVQHATFGAGMVKEAFEENGNEKILIRFDKSGEKTLLLKFARLQRL